MNIVNLVENKKYGIGLAERKCYDVALRRLMCVAKENVSKSISAEEPANDAVTMACKFARKKGTEDVLALATEYGKLVINQTGKRRKTPSYSFSAHFNAIFDIAWCEVDDQLIVGSGDHTVSMWDVGEHSKKCKFEFDKHTSSVKSVCYSPQSKSVFASGARDGLIMLWDCRDYNPNTAQIQPFNTIRNLIYQSDKDSRPRLLKMRNYDSVSTVRFQNERMLLSCTVGEGVIKVWDIRKFYGSYKRIPQAVYTLRHPTNVARYCYTDLILDPNCVKLYASCMDNTIYCYNVASYHTLPVSKYTGHEVSSMFVKNSLSPDGRYLISGSTDHNCYIWRTEKPGDPVMRLKGHVSEVTCVDWSQGSEMKIASCADDMLEDANSSLALIWRVESDEIRDKFTSLRSNDKLCQTIGDLTCYGWGEEIFSEPPVLRKPSYRYFTPIKTKKSEEDESASFANSPTLNLPNHVIDGTSPSHRCCTYSREKENSNWLVNLQIKTPPVQSKSSSKTRLKRLRHDKPKICGNLLKFFTVTSKQVVDK